MRAKVKNDASRYVTRASLASFGLDKALPLQPTTELAEQQGGNAAGVIDKRWYIQLAPKHRAT